MALTVGKLLRDGAARLADSGSETPRLDAELLLGHVLGVDRATLLGAPEAGVGNGQAEAFTAAVERRAKGEPIAYIRGIKEFYGLALSVDPRALIPRPETELLVELALERVGVLLTAAPREAGVPLSVWDVGTGSGAIAVALAVESRRRRYDQDLAILATDISPEALALAIENAVGHGVADMIEFAPADLLAGVEHAPVDLLLANLPYVPSAVVPTLPVAASYEPVAALDGGPDGLDLVRRLMLELPGALCATGLALLEIGSDQADAVVSVAAELLPGWQVEIRPDLAERPRVAELRRGIN